MAVLTIRPEARVFMTCGECGWWADVTEVNLWGTIAPNMARDHVHERHDPRIDIPKMRLRGMAAISLGLDGRYPTRFLPPFVVVNGQISNRAPELMIHEKFWWDTERLQFRRIKDWNS